ncbi:MAG: hypothetical protein JSU06_12160 [Actinobacteria bacterium]|nr:hypothetical protein [Actinomycetota bacterium]
MRRRLFTLALLLAAVGALTGLARAEVVQSGDLRVAFHAGFSPQALPRERPAPIAVEVEGRISTTDGSHPPPLDALRIELSSAGRIDARGLPRCRAALIQSTSSAAALARCRGALVGRGTFVAQLAAAGQILVPGQALVFNGTVGGRPGMLVHIYLSRPVRLTLVVPIRIGPGEGGFGTVLTARVPELAGGSASITKLRLRIARRYTAGGERRSYLSAACAAPAGFPGAVFPFARGTFSFAGGRTVHSVLTRSCTVRAG